MSSNLIVDDKEADSTISPNNETHDNDLRESRDITVENYSMENPNEVDDGASHGKTDNVIFANNH